MADYVASNTPRLKVTQTGPRGTHKMTFRVVPGTSVADAISAVQPVIEAMFPILLNGVTWASAEYAAEGSDVFLPTTFAPIPQGGATENVDNSYPYGQYVNFIGRSTGGSRVAFYLFNVTKATMTANNRLTAAEAASLTNILTVFAANADVLCGIDQNPFVLKAYANTGINDDVAKKARALA